MSSQTSLITNFKNNAEKVGRLNQKTSDEIASILSKYRKHYHPHSIPISGRKLKFLFTGLSFLFMSSGTHAKNKRKFISFYERFVVIEQKKLLPIFQMLEDRDYIIVRKREQAVINFSMANYKNKDLLEKLRYPFKTTTDFVPYKDKNIISNLTQPGSFKLTPKQYLAKSCPGFYNLSI